MNKKNKKKLIEFLIWREYGSIRDMAIEKGISRTTMVRYLNRYVEGKRPSRPTGNDRYDYFRFEKDVEALLESFNEDIQRVSEAMGITYVDLKDAVYYLAMKLGTPYEKRNGTDGQA